MNFSRRRLLLSVGIVGLVLGVSALTGWSIWFSNVEGRALQTGAIQAAQVRHVDFGDVAVQSLETRQFKILNETGQVWRIGNIKTGCACTSCDIDDRTIPPGQILEGSMTIHTPDEPGSFGVIAEVQFMEKPGITLKASANVIEYVTAIPPRFEITIPEGHTGAVKRQLSVQCRSVTDEPPVVANRTSWCRVKRIGRSSPSDTASDVMGPVWHYELLFSPEGLPTTREGSSTIRVEFGEDARFRVNIPVQLTLSKTIAVLPQQIYFGRCRVEELLSETLILTINNPEIAAKSIIVSPTSGIADFITVTAQPLSNSLVRIVISAKPVVPGAIRGNVLIQDRDGGILGSVPVFGLVEAHDSSVSLNGL